MTKWKTYIPEGVQDILVDSCYQKRDIESKIREVFLSFGYFEIETPSLEFLDTFSLEFDLIPQENMFKVFDQNGRILVLRPDSTIPIARIASTKYKDMLGPQRFSYIQNKFRYNTQESIHLKEYTQAGIEFIGTSTAEADAEVIACAITTLKKLGLENFQIDIGQVEFFKGIMEETGLPETKIEEIRVLIDHKDYLGLAEEVNLYDIEDELKELILDMPKLFGSVDIINQVEGKSINKRSREALDNLKEVLNILEDYGMTRYVSVDLGMLQSLNYYSGIIFKGFTYGIGIPILSGGRYDNLLEKYGKQSPATGFALGINFIMIALERQKIVFEKPKIHGLICYEEVGRKAAIFICHELRKQGLLVEFDVMSFDLGEAKRYCKSKGIGGMFFVLDNTNIQVYNLETGEVVLKRLSDIVAIGGSS